jgi:MYXO-CTERM domain-containing protein
VPGERFERTAAVAQLDAKQITFDNVICGGDSGGPSLATLNGREVIVGVHSHSSTRPCGDDNGGLDDRIDLYAASFVDPFIAAADPGFLPPAVADAGSSDDASANEVAATPTSETSSSGCSVSPSHAPARSDLAIAVMALALLARRSRRRSS